MLRNAFTGQAKPPTPQELASSLGQADILWRGLVADLKRDLRLDAEEWNRYSAKAGWSLRLQFRKRNIVYLSPGAGCFLASFALKSSAVAAARKANLPSSVLEMIDQAKRYAEGTAVRIEVHDATDASVVKTLAKIKVES